jgi:hypothetical protein
MASEFQGMKLTEYKLTREHSDMREKLDYYTRLLKKTQDEIFSLEKTTAESEAKMLKEREEFRKRDMERKEMLFRGSRWNDDGDVVQNRRPGSVGQKIQHGSAHTAMDNIGRPDQERLQHNLTLKKMDQQPALQNEYTASWTNQAIGDEKQAHL